MLRTQTPILLTKIIFTATEPFTLGQLTLRSLRMHASSFDERSIPVTTEDEKHQEDLIHAMQKNK